MKCFAWGDDAFLVLLYSGISKDIFGVRSGDGDDVPRYKFMIIFVFVGFRQPVRFSFISSIVLGDAIGQWVYDLPEEGKRTIVFFIGWKRRLSWALVYAYGRFYCLCCPLLGANGFSLFFSSVLLPCYHVENVTGLSSFIVSSAATALSSIDHL